MDRLILNMRPSTPTTAMKPTSFILPAIALILVGSWVGPQRRSMAAVETECVRLRTHIAAVRSASPATSTAHDPLETRRKVIGWKNIAAHFPSNPGMSSGTVFGALPDPRVAMRFRQRMEAMSADEIIATLDEIAALDLPPEAHENLEWTLLDALVRKDPELALDRFVDRVGKDSFLFRDLLSGALQAWAKRDVDAAVAWFDQQLAAGKFKSTTLDGVSYPRLSAETELINRLLANSPEAAARRLTALPENQRRDVLQTHPLHVIPGVEELAALAKLIRAYVPAEEQAEMIGYQAAHFFNPGGYSAVTAYLERIDATPDERAAFALRVTEMIYPGSGSNYLSREPIDGLREWVRSQAPDATDNVMGKVLGQAAWGSRKMKFAAAAELAVQYSAASGSDEVLATFLTSYAARENKPAARALAEEISDEQRRGEILTFLK